MNRPVRVQLSEAETSRASRTYWDQVADEYLAEHGEFLGEDRFIWSPEGVDGPARVESLRRGPGHQHVVVLEA